jgi:hypothetical protein
MDEQKSESHLDRAERDVASAHRHVARQRELISALRAGGHDTSLAEALLQAFLQGSEAMEDHRRIILEELGLYDRAARRVTRERRSG